jgi:predicted branched-subunit amino acid permease
VFVALFAAWLAWPGRLSFGLLFGWTLPPCAVGGLLSVLPLPFLPFVPEQAIQHYVAHALYAGCQLPLLFRSLSPPPGASQLSSTESRRVPAFWISRPAIAWAASG